MTVTRADLWKRFNEELDLLGFGDVILGKAVGIRQGFVQLTIQFDEHKTTTVMTEKKIERE